MSNSIRVCKVIITFESYVPHPYKSKVVEFYVNLPVKDKESYERSALDAISWLDRIVEPNLEYNIEICPPFTIVHGMRLV